MFSVYLGDGFQRTKIAAGFLTAWAIATPAWAQFVEAAPSGSSADATVSSSRDQSYYAYEAYAQELADDSQDVAGDTSGAGHGRVYREASTAIEASNAAEAEIAANAEAAGAAAAGAAGGKKKKGNPAATAYKGVFYDNDFQYLCDPGADACWYLGDYWKRLTIGDCWTVDAGGEYRFRQHSEDDLRGSNLTGRDDDFILHRTRLYLNAEYGGAFRFYGEAIDAVSEQENWAPRTIEENRFDALNLFADALVTDSGNGKLWFRGGRQELLYGEQRLISPLDWGNTRRTFDGLKLFWRGDDWNADVFWTRPVGFAQHVNFDHNFDHPNLDQEFMGAYASYKGCENQTYDFYFLRLGDYSNAPFDTNLFGARWKSKYYEYLAEVEAGYEFGDVGANNQSAGFFTAGLGYEWNDVAWKPVTWAYFDWASGDDDPTDGSNNTFNQLFPLGHKYFGFADLVGRQNIQDLNFLVTAKPAEKWNLLFWWHIFYLDQARDSLYNAAGTAIRTDATGASGRYVGQELDWTLQYVINPRTDILFGYSHFYAGSFVTRTNPAGVDGDVDFYYTQFTWRF